MHHQHPACDALIASSIFQYSVLISSLYGFEPRWKNKIKKKTNKQKAAFPSCMFRRRECDFGYSGALQSLFWRSRMIDIGRWLHVLSAQVARTLFFSTRRLEKGDSVPVLIVQIERKFQSFSKWNINQSASETLSSFFRPCERRDDVDGLPSTPLVLVSHLSNTHIYTSI